MRHLYISLPTEGLGAWRAISDVRAWPFRQMQVWDACAPGEIRFDAKEVWAGFRWLLRNDVILTLATGESNSAGCLGFRALALH
jgi:hypothetical protein